MRADAISARTMPPSRCMRLQWLSRPAVLRKEIDCRAGLEWSNTFQAPATHVLARDRARGPPLRAR